MLVAAQGVDLRRPARLGTSSASLHGAIRTVVPPLNEDRESGADVEKIVTVLRSGAGATE